LSDISLIKGSNIYSFSLSSLGNTLSIKVGSMSEADLRSWYDMIRECQGRGNSLRGGVIPMPKREAATSSGSSALRPERPVGVCCAIVRARERVCVCTCVFLLTTTRIVCVGRCNLDQGYASSSARQCSGESIILDA